MEQVKRSVPGESAIIIHTFRSYCHCFSVLSSSDSGTEYEDQRPFDLP